MPLENKKEEMVQCPYVPAHIVRESRLQFHLVKCKKNHPGVNYVECPFNTTHKIPEIELNCHKRYLCSDRKKIDSFICSTEQAEPLFPVKNYEVQSSENWDDVQVPNYDPKEHCQALPVIIGIQGATPSERKHHKAGERQRFQEIERSTVLPQHNIETKEKEVIRLPQTASTAKFDNAGSMDNGKKPACGRGRGRILN